MSIITQGCDAEPFKTGPNKLALELDGEEQNRCRGKLPHILLSGSELIFLRRVENWLAQSHLALHSGDVPQMT